MRTKNKVEEFNRQIRKIMKTKGDFTNDESLFILVFLVFSDRVDRKKMNYYKIYIIRYGDIYLRNNAKQLNAYLTKMKQAT